MSFVGRSDSTAVSGSVGYQPDPGTNAARHPKVTLPLLARDRRFSVMAGWVMYRHKRSNFLR